jgi:hypothetical protein
MALFGVAFYAGRRLRTAVRSDVSHPEEQVATAA